MVDEDARRALTEIKQGLEAQAPEGAARDPFEQAEHGETRWRSAVTDILPG